MVQTEVYNPKNPVRFVTASSLFDGHDASINIMRRILQASGVEVIHLGHNRSVEEVVYAAVQEDAQAIAISSYQGGHVEYFKYVVDLLKELGADHIKIFGGGGGTIIPREIKELHTYGVDWIFSPEDGRKYGLQGMINRIIEKSDFIPPIDFKKDKERLYNSERDALAKFITYMENTDDDSENKQTLLTELREKGDENLPVLGITGTGGAGKSSLTDELIRRFLNEVPNKKIAVISIDPTKRKTGGALLGDRIRMNAISNNRVYMRSLATRDSRDELSKAITDVLDVVRASGFDFIIIETSGIGQGNAAITDVTDLSMYVMTAEFGAPTQLEKIDMIDYADFIVINKFEQRGSEDALNQVRKQYERSRMLFHEDKEKFPVFGTIASQFNDKGTNSLFAAIIDTLNDRYGWEETVDFERNALSEKQNQIISTDRRHYLQEIGSYIRNYNEKIETQSEIARKLYQLGGVKDLIEDEEAKELINQTIVSYEKKLDRDSAELLDSWDETQERYSKDTMTFKIRDKEIVTDIVTKSLSVGSCGKISIKSFESWDFRTGMYRQLS